MTSGQLIRISLDDLSAASEAALHRRGFGRVEAADITNYCTRATAEGHIEHGIGALWILDQQHELTPGHGPIRVDIQGGRCVRVSARRYLGFLPATRAVEAVGSLNREGDAPAWATVISRGFRGRLGHIVRPLAMRGLIGIAIGGTAPVVAYKSRTAALGTNPIAIAIPIADGVIVSDVATAGTTYTRNFLHRAHVIPSKPSPLHVWGKTRGMALFVAIQALCSVATGVPLLPTEHWGLVVLAIPAPTVHAKQLNGTLTRWIDQLGLQWLPGQHSDARRRRAEVEGLSIPKRLWRWLAR